MFKNIIIVLFCPSAVKDEQSANRQQQPHSEFQTKPNFKVAFSKQKLTDHIEGLVQNCCNNLILYRKLQ